MLNCYGGDDSGTATPNEPVNEDSTCDAIVDIYIYWYLDCAMAYYKRELVYQSDQHYLSTLRSPELKLFNHNSTFLKQGMVSIINKLIAFKIGLI